MAYGKDTCALVQETWVMGRVMECGGKGHEPWENRHTTKYGKVWKIGERDMDLE
jgi:hypothetical protein